MSQIDIDGLRQWIGRPTIDEDLLSVRHARLMAATLGLPQDTLRPGTPLPPLWHWLYFLQGVAPSELGRDSHPARGGFLPPVPLANRMWAGGELTFDGVLPLGAPARKRSSVESVEHKQGRSGDLVFVTVRHEVLHEGRVAVSEAHDIVFKNASPGRPGAVPPELPTPSHRAPFVPDATTLFRYSALTFNGHRIHYDADYCREVEGYPDLVVHGPLNATMLAGLAQQIGGRPLKRFRYRALQPSLLGQPLTLNAAPDEHGLTLWVALPDGAVSMRAEASF
jgi:3-methylfumaryl-CoA hydratase